MNMIPRREGSTRQDQFRIIDTISIVPFLGKYVVYRSALTGLPPVWIVCDTIEEAHEARKGA